MDSCVVFNKRLFTHLLDGFVVIIGDPNSTELCQSRVFYSKDNELYEYIKEGKISPIVYRKDYSFSKFCSLFYEVYKDDCLRLVQVTLDQYRDSCREGVHHGE